MQRQSLTMVADVDVLSSTSRRNWAETGKYGVRQKVLAHLGPQGSHTRTWLAATKPGSQPTPSGLTPMRTPPLGGAASGLRQVDRVCSDGDGGVRIP